MKTGRCLQYLPWTPGVDSGNQTRVQDPSQEFISSFAGSAAFPQSKLLILHIVLHQSVKTRTFQPKKLQSSFINAIAIGSPDSVYSIARATLSGVIGPVLTEIHRSSSSLPELFFFLVFDLDVTEACPLQQRQQLLP